MNMLSTRRPQEYGFDMKFNSGGTREIHGDIGDGTQWLSTTADYNLPGTDEFAEKWFFVVFTVTEFGYRIYLNGEEVVPFNTGLPPSGCCSPTGFDQVNGSDPLVHDKRHDLYIGRWRHGVEQFDGIIDEMAIFRKELSPEQVKEMYEVGASRDRGRDDS